MDETKALATGGTLRVREDFLCLSFDRDRRALSTALYGGGFRDVRHAMNRKLTTFYPAEKDFPGGSVAEFLRLSLLEEGYDPEKSAAMITAAKMEWHSHVVKSKGSLIVEAVTTGGVEKTACRAGSPALYEEIAGVFAPPGTINIILSVNASLADYVMVRALITATEGKTAALSDMGVADVNNGLPATGTDTDGVILLTDPEGPPLTDAGTFSVLGSLIAEAARDSVLLLDRYDSPWNRSPALVTPRAVDLETLRAGKK